MNAEQPWEEFYHRPVMVDEVISAMGHAPVGVLCDATVGGGGHAEAMLEAFPNQKVLGSDRDEAALSFSRGRLRRFGGRIRLIHGAFADLADFPYRDEVQDLFGDGDRQFQGVLADLGVSSRHLEDSSRGFSFRGDAPLDMRMDQHSGDMTAAVVLNTYDESRLIQLFRDNGEGRLARRYVRAIVDARPVQSTYELANLIEEATPAALRRGRIHPATRIFQALRIEVNGEIFELESLLGALTQCVAVGGVVIIISYHSGEDRLVKAAFRRASQGECSCPPKLPCVCGSRSWAKLLGRPMKTPSEAEITSNPRARSAKMRVLQVTSSPNGGGDISG